MIYPLVEEIPYCSPLSVFALFSKMDGAVFLDSAKTHVHLGRYSFIAIDPFHKIGVNSEANPFLELKQALSLYQLQNHTGLPPFQGGMAGFLSYDLVHQLEILPKSDDVMKFPQLLVGLYDLVIAFDHVTEQAWVFSSGFPELDIALRKQRAQQRMGWLLEKINETKHTIFSAPHDLPAIKVLANFTSDRYEAAVKKVVEYILAGDIFEANISQCFSAELPVEFPLFGLYQRLREINPAPFAAFVNFPEACLISASPERFIQLQNKKVETRPIKGTRARHANSLQDVDMGNELLASEKDRAENVMIVDLMRNDVSRVCEDFSVQVPVLCGLETYATLHHLVSVVTGRLKREHDAIDLLQAVFPGGSITGAPKIRAMEIIAEIEPTVRGPYCGSIGYIGFNGDMDLSIVIRTFACKDGQLTFQVGGAVVADSDAQLEYEETLVKARGLLLALQKGS